MLVKNQLARALRMTGWMRVGLSRRGKREYVILMYHRVLHREQTKGIQPGMYVDAGTFENHVNFLRENFEMIALERLFSYITSGFPPQSPLCVLTFDDGWVDFYENVYPVLCKYQIPATVFLATNFVGRVDRCFWTDQLANVLQMERLRERVTSFKVLNPDARFLASLRGSQEDRLEQAIELLKSFPQIRIDCALADLRYYWGADIPVGSRMFISWKEAREMKRSGLVTFGSHTAEHKILTLCSDEEVASELSDSKKRLERETLIDDGLAAFCYPNGNHDHRIENMVREAGYQIAVTTESGWNKWKSDPMSLRRIGIHQDVTSTTAMLACRIAELI